MIRTVRRLRRALALATAGALCLSSFAGAPQAFAASAVPSIDIPVDVSSLTIPEQLGHITEAWQPQQPSKANGLIVYIQDIHTHPEAQAKISELIAILQKRLGITGDWSNPYLTMAFTYQAAIVRALGRFVERGLVYKGKKPVYWCLRDRTALADDLEGLDRGARVDEALRRIAATMACHAAVKANYPLTPEKMAHILEELQRTAYSTICPHGRPVMLRLTRREIEKNFQRI